MEGLELGGLLVGLGEELGGVVVVGGEEGVGEESSPWFSTGGSVGVGVGARVVLKCMRVLVGVGGVLGLVFGVGWCVLFWGMVVSFGWVGEFGALGAGGSE